MLNRRYQLLLLAVLVLAAYYPAVLADFSKIDDAQMAESYRSVQEWSWHSAFIPRSGGGLYYRPLLVISFLVDKDTFGLLPGLMHFENVLLHLLNAILVYFLTFFLLSPATRAKSYLPLLSAILFGLHPINTESVNWISGRTDVLSGSFIFISALLLLLYRERSEKLYFALAVCSFLGGTLTKETALAFLPGAFLIMSAAKPERHVADGHTPLRGIRMYNVMLVVGAILIVLVLYLLRSMAFTSNASRIAITLQSIFTDLNHSLLVALRAFGFYMKKLVFPYPLNFAIVEVDPLYELLAVPLVAFCIYIASHRTGLSAIFMTGIFLITPSFILAFGQMAWTPYAERYVYITSAFFIVSAAVYIHKQMPDRIALWARVMAFVLIVMLFIAVLSRCLIWQDDVKLCRDTVEKSPMAKDIKIPYASLLADKGDFTEALRQLELGRSISSLEYDERFDLGFAKTYYLQGRVDEAIAMSEQVLSRSKGKSLQALIYLTSIMDEKRGTGRNRGENALILKRIFAYNIHLYDMNHDPHVLYRAGAAAAELGDDIVASNALQRAYNDLPADDYYKWYAKNKMNRLAHTGK